MRQHLEPSAAHPITIEHKAEPVRVELAGEGVLNSKSHLELKEATYPAVAYIPRDEVSLDALVRSNHTTWCPYKGEAAYYHIRTANGGLIENAVWTYEDPFPAVAGIKDALAVYPTKVDAIQIG